MARLCFSSLSPVGCPPLGVTDGDGRVTVQTFHVVLVSKLTQYDMKQQGKRGYNHYALGHYLRGAQEARDAVTRYKDQGAPATLRAYQQALRVNFTTSGARWGQEITEDMKFSLPPVTAVYKQINEYLATALCPSLVK